MGPERSLLRVSTVRRSRPISIGPIATAKPSKREFKGRLAGLAAGEGAGRALAEAVKQYEGIDDRLGRLISYASLVYAGNTTDPDRAKFYGDVQERITAASLHLLFFTLELNRVPDEQLDAAMGDPALGHYRPWIEDVRKEKPYQLEDRVEELFHEKSVTGYSAWNRSFDETIAGLRFKVGGKLLAIEPTLNLLQDADGKKRKAAAEALSQNFQGKFAPLRADHQYAGEGQGNFRSLARLQGYCRRTASLEPGRERGGGCIGCGCARRLSEIVASLLCPEGEMVRQEAIAVLGPQRSAAEGCAAHDSLDRCARDGAYGLWRVLAAHGGSGRPIFCQELDRCAGASRKTAGRLCASDGAIGASLRPAQLYGAGRAT